MTSNGWRQAAGSEQRAVGGNDVKLVGGGQETRVERKGNFRISRKKVKVEIHSFEIKKIPHKNIWNFKIPL